MSDWIRVCGQSELLPGENKIAWDGDVAIAVFNIDGTLYAIEDVCTHDGGELASGELADMAIKTLKAQYENEQEQIDALRSRILGLEGSVTRPVPQTSEVATGTAKP